MVSLEPELAKASFAASRGVRHVLEGALQVDEAATYRVLNREVTCLLIARGWCD